MPECQIQAVPEAVDYAHNHIRLQVHLYDWQERLEIDLGLAY